MGAYRDLILSDGPSSFWLLGETAGTTAADQKAAVSGTYAAAAALGQTGIVAAEGSAKSVGITNSATSRVDMGSVYGFSGTQSFTIEGWFRSTSTSGRVVVSCLDATNANGWQLTGNGGSALIFQRIVAGVAKAATKTGLTSLYTGARHYFAVVYDGAVSRLYVDDLAVAVGVADTASLPSGGAFKVGIAGNNQNPLIGQVQDLAVYGTTLTATQIAQHYAIGNVPPIDYPTDAVITPHRTTDATIVPHRASDAAIEVNMSDATIKPRSTDATMAAA